MNVGDLGGGLGSLKDRRAEERAIREGWKVPQEVRDKVIARLFETLNDPNAKLRHKLVAARTLASNDLRQQEIDLAKEKAALEAAGAIDLEAAARAVIEADEQFDAASSGNQTA